jgi:NADH dehydrogenase
VILVAGGTGRLGTLVVRRLVARGLDVRVLTRDAQRAAHLGPSVEVSTGDVRNPRSVAQATAGADTVLSAVHGFVGPRGVSPATIDRDGNANLIDATKAAGAALVLMSTVGAAADSPMELFRMKHAAEEHAAASGVPTTVVRATAFLELWIELLGQTVGRAGRPLVFGRGNNPINFVAVDDVAAVVERAITDPTTHRATLEIGGPDNLTFNQLAQAVQDAAGRAGAPRHVPPPMLRVMAETVGRVKPQLGRQARAALAMDRVDLTFDAAPIHLAYPDLASTSVAHVLASSTPAP